MATQLSNSAFAASIAHDESLNAFQDIVWSLQFALCGAVDAQGGFCTFLYDANTPILTGGGIGASLGYAPSSGYNGFTEIKGVSGALIGVAIDTNGLFALSGNGKTTGIGSNTGPALTIRTGSNFDYLTTIALTALDASFSLLSSALTYNTLRFRLHSSGTMLEVAQLQNSEYRVLLDQPVNLGITPASFCKVGVSYAAPLCGISTAAKFAIKNFHIEGSQQQPVVSNTYNNFVYEFPVIQSLSITTPEPIPLLDIPLAPFDGPYTAPTAPTSEVVIDPVCIRSCLEPFVLSLVLDNTFTTSNGTEVAQIAYKVLENYTPTDTIKGISIVTFGDVVSPQAITFDSSVQEARTFLETAIIDSCALNFVPITQFYPQGYLANDVGPLNGVKALYDGLTSLQSYDTSYKKYLYFVSNSPIYSADASFTSSVETISELIEKETDGAWFLLNRNKNTFFTTSSYENNNSFYETSFIPTTSEKIKYDFFPACPTIPKLNCRAPVRGGKGTYSFAYDLANSSNVIVTLTACTFGPKPVSISFTSATLTYPRTYFFCNLTDSTLSEFLTSLRFYNETLTAAGYGTPNNILNTRTGVTNFYAACGSIIYAMSGEFIRVFDCGTRGVVDIFSRTTPTLYGDYSFETFNIYKAQSNPGDLIVTVQSPFAGSSWSVGIPYTQCSAAPTPLPPILISNPWTVYSSCNSYRDGIISATYYTGELDTILQFGVVVYYDAGQLTPATNISFVVDGLIYTTNNEGKISNNGAVCTYSLPVNFTGCNAEINDQVIYTSSTVTTLTGLYEAVATIYLDVDRINLLTLGTIYQAGEYAYITTDGSGVVDNVFYCAT